MGILSKKSGSVTHNYIWAPNTMLSFRKNEWANPEKTYRQMKGWMEGRTEGPTEGQILFHRTLPAEAGGPKRILQNCFAVIFWQPHRLSQMKWSPDQPLTHFIPLVSFYTPWKISNLCFMFSGGHRKTLVEWNALTGSWNIFINCK